MYHNALPAALILPFPGSNAGTVADRQARRLAVLALPGSCVCLRTRNNACFMDVMRGRDAIDDVGCHASGARPMIEMIEMLLALWVLPSLLTLALMLLMLFSAPRWRGNPWVYRVGFALLGGFLTPTLLGAGHGGLPCATIGGLVMILTQLQWIGDLQIGFMGIGIRNRGIWIMSTPALVVFAAMMFVPLRTARPARFGFGDDGNGNGNGNG
ncbi:hypothetical protein [Stenotrophomonas pavanii]|uniref:hypothetical protein n=1 Tax=Stenotrophomonas pavanii TaxID=487698 RepID=UPI0021751456|nr:hypothetical protein [Stenotrophomonas pavanii]